ncbi:MAG: helix-turn-helix transcriptional regulator [Microbacterium sp.]
MSTPIDGAVLRSLQDAREAEDWDAVLVLLRDEWSALVQDAPQAVIDVIHALPPDVLAQNSRLRLAEQYLRRTLDGQPEGRAYTDIISDDPAAAPLDRLAALTGRIAVARGAGRHRDAVRATESAVSMLRSIPVEVIPTFANALPEFHYHWGVAFLLVSRFDDALEQFAQSHDWSVSVGNRMVDSRSVGAASLIHALHGRGRDAAEWLGRMPEIPEGVWWADDAVTPARLAEAILHTERLEPDAARVVLSGVDIRLAPDYWGPYFALRAFLTPDDPGDAQALLSEFDAFVGGLAPEYANVPLNAEYSSIVRYLLLQILHQPQRASRALGDLPVDTASSVVRQTGATLHAFRLFALDRGAEARAVVAPLLQASSAHPRVLVPSLLIAADTDVVDQRDELLRRAAALASWNRCHAALALGSAKTRQRLAELVDERGDHDIADRLRAVVDNAAIAGTDALTRRENAVVRAAVAGRSNVEIAADHHVSVNTVKTHLRTAYRKLGVSNRAQLQQLFQLGR